MGHKKYAGYDTVLAPNPYYKLSPFLHSLQVYICLSPLHRWGHGDARAYSTPGGNIEQQRSIANHEFGAARRVCGISVVFTWMDAYPPSCKYNE